MYTPEFEGHPPGYFPPTEELVATSAPLKAAAFYIGDQCNAQNDDYMTCKEASVNDPFACLKEGRRVTNCVQHVFFQLHQKCYEDFTKYWRCLDNNNQRYIFCRQEEFSLENCAINNLKWQKKLWIADRPEAGFKEHEDIPGAESIEYKRFVDRHKNPY